jgi:hypothetical protein
MIRIDQPSKNSSHRSRSRKSVAHADIQPRKRSCPTTAEAIDQKLKAALRRARSLMFHSPRWNVEFETTDES